MKYSYSFHSFNKRTFDFFKEKRRLGVIWDNAEPRKDFSKATNAHFERIFFGKTTYDKGVYVEC